MKRGRRLLLLLLGFGAVIVVVAVWGYEREPRYRGRTLREWVACFEMGMDDGATPAGTVKGREAMEAFHHMRERVLPRAVRLVRYEKPEWKNKAERFMETHMHAWRWTPRWVWAPLFDDPRYEGVIYFRMLGADGSPVIPKLDALATDPRGGKSAGRAVDALG